MYQYEELLVNLHIFYLENSTLSEVYSFQQLTPGKKTMQISAFTN